MQTAQEIIDGILTDLHQVSTTKVAAAAYTRLRARILRNLRKCVIRLWHLRDWIFTYVKDETIVIAAGDSDDDLTALPAGSWISDGQDGGVWTKDDPRYPLTYVRPGKINDLLQTSSETGPPRLYSVVGVRTLRVFPKPSSTTNLVAEYKAAAPVPADIADDPALLPIPIDWIDSVLYAMVELKEMMDKGDVAGIPGAREDLKEALFGMVCNERQGKPWEQNMPRFAGSADVGPDDMLL